MITEKNLAALHELREAADCVSRNIADALAGIMPASLSIADALAAVKEVQEAAKRIL